MAVAAALIGAGLGASFGCGLYTSMGDESLLLGALSTFTPAHGLGTLNRNVIYC
jgi:hypothetical protein